MTPRTPLVLHIGNERGPLGPHTRFGAAFASLAADGLLRYACVTPGTGQPLPADVRPCAVFVQSPQPRPWRRRDVLGWLGAIGAPPVVVWEGETWSGLSRPPRERNLVWMRCAEEIYSVAMGPQAALLQRAARRPVHYVPHTVPQPFLDEPAHPEPSGVALIAGRGREHRLLARELRGLLAGDPMPYRPEHPESPGALRRALVTVGWHRHRHHAGYFCERLPLALGAGRAHVGPRRPGLEWLPGPEHGLHLVDTPRQAADRVRELLRQDPAELLRRAAGLRTWATARLTERHALQHMLRAYVPLPAPPSDPWEGFPTHQGFWA
ncbi:hypothetical protein ACFYMW_02340 [Streptomyces sp. NPDC006692]|uniref:hypothetical protein n=1 Tax=Streptomyces sp. NPDC006692 TaxID=3364758 RepID=UPI00368D2BDA